MIAPHLRRTALRPHVRPGYWFVPKRIGYGAVPATPAGWLVTFAFVAAAALAGWGVPTDAGKIIVITCMTLGFLVLVAIKTDGGWRWRWGGDA